MTGNSVIQVMADFIRARSREGHLTAQQEISEHLHETGLLNEREEGQAVLDQILGEALERNADLRQLKDQASMPFLYSAQHMTEAYAELLFRKKGNPVMMMAEVVRENSALYPRPVPLDTFRNPPFDMTDREITTCLRQMGEQEGLGDICQTTTSIGTVFLFSSLHLDPGHGAMLAEWLDVGESQNP